jgi:hypothetical protein
MKEQTSLQVVEPAALERAPQTDFASQLLAVVEKNPAMAAENIKAILDAMERAAKWQAKVAFDEAMRRLQPRIPNIPKTREIVVKGVLRSKYAAYEDIERIIRPLYTEEGFSVSYTMERADEKSVRIVGRLHHVMGHDEFSETTLPFDKSDFRSDVQSWRSTESFGKRGVLCNMFNVVCEGLDKDGNERLLIDETQRDNITNMFSECAMGPDSQAKFLEIMKCKAVADIPKSEYGNAMARLNEKLRKVRGQ